MSTSTDHIPKLKLKLIDSSLRLSVISVTVATIWLTITDHQDNSSYGMLSFSNFTGVKYMICICFISAIYALITTIFSWITVLVLRPCLFFVFDQMVAYSLVTSTAAVVDILYLSYDGDKEVTWSEACSSYGKFCSRLKLALIFQGVSFCFFLVLAVISAFRAFSLYNPPCRGDEPKKIIAENDPHVMVRA